MSPPLLVLVGGGTASGKTTVTRLAAERLGALLIAHDRYYYDAPNPVERNFDDPASLQTELLVEHIRQLLAGRAVQLPRYHFPTHTRDAATDLARPAPVIIVEGILVLASPQLRELAALSVFVHADADLRLARRVRRDIAERGRDTADILRQYLCQVRPAHLRYVEPARADADLELDGEASIETAVDRLVEAVVGLRGAP